MNLLPDQFDIRPAGPEDAAGLFVVHAAITATDANSMLDWTGELEERLESGGLAWVVARGRRLVGYGLIDSIPGLPGVYDLSGGIVPARRRRGLGGRLLQHIKDGTKSAGIRQLSCRVDGLEDETAAFLLRRGFFVEHEECLLELAASVPLPPIPDGPPSDLVSYPPEKAIAAFCRVYDEGFSGRAWSQPYSEAEVASSLARPEDLLFAEMAGEPVGVVWHELLADGRGRVEPLGIVPEWQRRGLGRRLLVTALHELRRRGAGSVEIGLWRDNAAAFNLYTSLGFIEADNWYFLAFDTTAG